MCFRISLALSDNFYYILRLCIYVYFLMFFSKWQLISARNIISLNTGIIRDDRFVCGCMPVCVCLFCGCDAMFICQTIHLPNWIRLDASSFSFLITFTSHVNKMAVSRIRHLGLCPFLRFQFIFPLYLCLHFFLMHTHFKINIKSLILLSSFHYF